MTDRRTELVALVIGAAGLVLHCGALAWGFIYDDYLHQFLLRGFADSGAWHLWNLYDFTPPRVALNPLPHWHFAPWWVDPDFSVRFLRPVASASIALDYALCGPAAFGYHLTNLAVFGLYLWLTWRLYRALGLWPRAALWGFAFVAFSAANTLPAGWIANRNSLLAATFGVASLLAVCRYQRRRSWSTGLIALAAYLLALGSKESGIATGVLALVALAILDRRQWSPDATDAPPDEIPAPSSLPAIASSRRRLFASPLSWSFIAVTALYLAVYIVGGYGTRAANYPLPWVDLAAYGQRLAVWLPVAIGAVFFGIVPDVLVPQPQLARLIAAALVPCVVLAVVAYRRVVGSSRLALFGAAWVLLSILVEAGGDLSLRLLMNASAGGGLLFGLYFGALDGWRSAYRNRRFGQVVLATLLVACAFVVAPVNHVLGSLAFSSLGARDRELIRTAAIDRSAPAPRSVFLLNAPTSLVGMSFAPTWMVETGDRETYVYPLQLGHRALSWTRDDARTMTLTSRGSPFIDNRIERLFTYRRVRRVGESWRIGPLTVVPLAVEPAGIRTVRLTFDQPLDDATYQFLAYENGRLVRVPPPTIGQTVDFSAISPTIPFAP